VRAVEQIEEWADEQFIAQGSIIIGGLDGLGWVNSRLNVQHTLVPGAMHHLNRAIPHYLDAQAQLSAVAGKS